MLQTSAPARAMHGLGEGVSMINWDNSSTAGPCYKMFVSAIEFAACETKLRTIRVFETNDEDQALAAMADLYGFLISSGNGEHWLKRHCKIYGVIVHVYLLKGEEQMTDFSPLEAEKLIAIGEELKKWRRL